MEFVTAATLTLKAAIVWTVEQQGKQRKREMITTFNVDVRGRRTVRRTTPGCVVTGLSAVGAGASSWEAGEW